MCINFSSPNYLPFAPNHQMALFIARHWERDRQLPPTDSPHMVSGALGPGRALARLAEPPAELDQDLDRACLGPTRATTRS